jgi:hypothetical protein
MLCDEYVLARPQGNRLEPIEAANSYSSVHCEIHFIAVSNMLEIQSFVFR